MNYRVLSIATSSVKCSISHQAVIFHHITQAREEEKISTSTFIYNIIHSPTKNGPGRSLCWIALKSLDQQKYLLATQSSALTTDQNQALPSISH